MNKIQIHPKYKPLFNLQTRYCLVQGGRGSGKSFGTTTAFCVGTRKNGRNILYTRYTMLSAKDSIIPEFTEKIDLLGLSNEFITKENNITNRYSDSVIKFRGIKTSQGNLTARLKSLNGINMWVLEEATEMEDEEEFNKINLSVRDKAISNHVILIYNPTDAGHWIYKRFFKKRGIPDDFCGIIDDTTYIHTTYQDNCANLPSDYLKEAANMLKGAPELYEHIWLGHWLKGNELGFKPDWFNRYDETALSKSKLNIYITVDPASGKKSQTAKPKNLDYTVMNVWGLAPDQNYYFLDGCRGRWNPMERYQRLTALVRKWKPIRVGYEEYGLQSDIFFFKKMMEQENYRFSLVPLGGGVSKRDRIYNLLPLYFQNRVWWPHRCIYSDERNNLFDYIQTFFDEEYLTFPRCVDSEVYHDDMFDCHARILDSTLGAIFPQQNNTPSGILFPEKEGRGGYDVMREE